MKSRPEFTKLVELRSKTDRQLVRFIHSRLDAGLYYVRLAADPDSDVHWTSGEAYHTSAAKAYAEVRGLMPWVGEMTKAERRRLESKWEDLRELLEGSTIHAAMRVQTACS